jgi:hypothetical protein
MFVKNSLKEFATSAGSETGDLLMGSMMFFSFFNGIITNVGNGIITNCFNEKKI